MDPSLLQFHTYFLFPFSIDKDTLLQENAGLWEQHQDWIEGFDKWIATDSGAVASPIHNRLGGWRRASYRRFDMDAPAYQDMLFFHPVVRRTFFDVESSGDEGESLLRTYTIPIPGNVHLRMEAEDRKGHQCGLSVTDLRLFLFANAIGILSIGVEACGIPVREALWANESLRKIYPSSGRQLREGRIPHRTTLRLERDGQAETLVEETWPSARMIGYQPPLSRLITSLLYFMDYSRLEFEPVLDERMIVYSYFALDPKSVGEKFHNQEAFQVLLSRMLYVDRYGADYRYDARFTRELMKQDLYDRWAHQGTYYGFTSYSAITVTIGTYDCDQHMLSEGFLVHRMFDTRYYLMAIVCLFYRATLLDFSEKTALISKRLYKDQAHGALAPATVETASEIRGQFLHFSNHWHFEELVNKDEEIEHYNMWSRAYHIGTMKAEIESEVEKLNAFLREHYQRRDTHAINRLAILSGLLGAAAVVTGYFGMNFGLLFERFFFEPLDRASSITHGAAIAAATLVAFGALTFGVYLVASHWHDYRDIVLPGAGRGSKRRMWQSLKRIQLQGEDEGGDAK